MKQTRLDPVNTVAELLTISTIHLSEADLAWVNNLDGIAPVNPMLPKTKWTGRMVFTRKDQFVDNDIIFRTADGGGFWIRVRDVP